MKQDNKLFITVAAAALLPYLLYGFRYFPILDDYIQYWCYPAHHDLSHIYLTIGTLSTRPLASLLDPAFWGQMWSFMWLALLLITAMHILSGVLLCKTLQRYGAAVSPLFLLIYLLLPLGMEGRFWLSASSRLVTGLFFASLSLYILSGFLQEKRTVGRFLLFALLQLISCGFYESVSIFSVGAAILLFCLSFYENRQKILLLVPAVSVINLGLMFAYYRVFANLGLQGSRAGGIDIRSLPAKTVEMFRQLGEVFSQFYAAIVKGCAAGVKVLCTNGLWGIVILLLIAAVSILLCRFAGRGSRQSKVRVLLFELAGLMLFFAPLAPNVLAADVWITNRSMFVSIIGLALMAEPLFGLLRGRWRQAVLFAVTFLFMTAAVNEYDVYRRVNEQDGRLLDQIIEKMDADSRAGRQNTRVVLPKPVETEQNAFYKDHVKSVFDSDWALTGAVRARMKSLGPQYVQPVLPNESYETENSQIIFLQFD